MQDKLINNIPVSIKIIILFFLISILMIAKSAYLIIFITILTLIIFIITDSNIKQHVDLFKNICIWLLFIAIIYIIICSNIVAFLVFLYKLVLSIILIKCIIHEVTFDELHGAIYTFLLPLYYTKVNIEKISFKITVDIYFLRFLMNSGNKISKSHTIFGKNKYSVKNFILPRLMLAIYDIKKVEENLKLKFYILKKEKINIKSILLLIMFTILFIISILKEVLL